jgi:hypothetical protein
MKAALADFLNPKQVGGALAAALGKTRITGKRDPQAWNKLFGTAERRPKVYRPVTGPGGLLDNNGNDPMYDSEPERDGRRLRAHGLGPDVGRRCRRRSPRSSLT